MTDYIKIAEELEKLADETNISLDKVAAASLIYEAGGVEDIDPVSHSALLKIASKSLNEADLGTKLGIEIGIDAFMKSLEV